MLLGISQVKRFLGQPMGKWELSDVARARRRLKISQRQIIIQTKNVAQRVQNKPAVQSLDQVLYSLRKVKSLSSHHYMSMPLHMF